MRRRRYGWLALALVLLAAAVWLMASPDDLTPAARSKVAFPRYLRAEEQERMERRRVQLPRPPPLPSAGPDAVPDSPPRPRDPILAALSREDHRTAVVIEANAIRHSPVGQLLLDCLNEADAEDLGAFEQGFGVNPLEDLDRVIVSDKAVMISGHFGGAKWDEPFAELTRSRYGDHGALYQRPDSRQHIATWNDQAVIVGRDVETIRRMIDRMEGRSKAEARPLISERQTYGEIYGVVSTEDLARLLPRDEGNLGQRLREAAQQVELHADTRGDVALVAAVQGPDGQKLSDLGKMLGGALSLARMQAMAGEDKELAALLDHAKVAREGDGFSLEVALPLEVLRKQLAGCRERSSPAAEVTR